MLYMIGREEEKEKYEQIYMRSQENTKYAVYNRAREKKEKDEY